MTFKTKIICVCVLLLRFAALNAIEIKNNEVNLVSLNVILKLPDL